MHICMYFAQIHVTITITTIFEQTTAAQRDNTIIIEQVIQFQQKKFNSQQWICGVASTNAQCGLPGSQAQAEEIGFLEVLRI